MRMHGYRDGLLFLLVVIRPTRCVRVCSHYTPPSSNHPTHPLPFPSLPKRTAPTHLVVQRQNGELHPVEDLPALGQEAVPHAGHHLCMCVDVCMYGGRGSALVFSVWGAHVYACIRFIFPRRIRSDSCSQTTTESRTHLEGEAVGEERDEPLREEHAVVHSLLFAFACCGVVGGL